MANEYFRFKRFTVMQQRCAMKVGTDGVLLGALCEMPDVEEGRAGRVLDVGTGTGLVALMAAQRFGEAEVDAIDIDDEAVRQARENVDASPFAGRVRVWRCDFKDMDGGAYDLIVSNPPFFKEDTSCPDSRRDAARRESSLPFADLVEKASGMLAGDGRLCVIIPHQSAAGFVMLCAMHRLYLRRRVDIRTTPRKEPKRTVMEFCRRPVPSASHTLLLRNADGSAAGEYRDLTSDFYVGLA